MLNKISLKQVIYIYIYIPFKVSCGPEQERLGLPSPDGQLPPTEIVEPKVTHKETISKGMNIQTPFQIVFSPEASKIKMNAGRER